MLPQAMRSIPVLAGLEHCMRPADFFGVSVPLITPFQPDGSLDLPSFRALVRKMLAAGVHGLVVNATTGEAPTLHWEEAEQLTALALEEAKGRARVILGTGSNDTASTVEQTRRAMALGVDAAMVVVPYYNRPSQAGIAAHFAQVTAVGLPIIVYNIPYRTGVAMEAATFRKVMTLPNVVGLKESTGGLGNTLDLATWCDRALLCGEDALYFPSLACGGQGGILAAAHFHTTEYVRIYQEVQAGEFVAARQRFLKLLPEIKLMFEESNPGPLKWLLAREGTIAHATQRLPLAEISDGLKERLAKLI
jgi:4-hydroxy-tetrahydrodipicolinate synthase